jgi:hypothetical protein
MAELARDEMEELQQQLEQRGEGLKFLLLPKDPLDEKNIMLEVGGEEAAVAPLLLQLACVRCAAADVLLALLLQLWELLPSLRLRCQRCRILPPLRAGARGHWRRGGGALGGRSHSPLPEVCRLAGAGYRKELVHIAQ